MDPKERKKLSLTALLALVSILVCLLTLTAATYAWFTFNRKVSTSRAETRTSSADVRLLISEKGGSAFQGSEEAAIVQVNRTDPEVLMPVSTADLRTFLYNPATIDNYATRFLEVENEEYYFHGRIYLKAEASGDVSGSTMALYLDQSALAGGVLVQDDEEDHGTSEGLLRNAARLGLTFGENGGDAVIFYLSDETNKKADRAFNTQLNGKVLGEGSVLTMEGRRVVAVDDPAVSLDLYSIDTDASSTLPGRTLLEMELDKIYPVDVYFYLEGCDPDCSDSISFDGVDLHLAFFGELR